MVSISYCSACVHAVYIVADGTRKKLYQSTLKIENDIGTVFHILSLTVYIDRCVFINPGLNSKRELLTTQKAQRTRFNFAKLT
jgi:hypothetical protein